MNGKKERSHKGYIVFVFLIVLVVCGTVIYIFNSLRSDNTSVKDAAEGVIEDAEEFYEDDIVGSTAKVQPDEISSSLEDIFAISELRTLSYTYNSICTVMDEDNEDVAYYVAYDGTVILGIDMSQVNINIDTNEGVIIVTLPPIEVKEQTVNASSLDYIFEDEAYDTPEVGVHAQSLCEADFNTKIANEIQGDSIMIQLARENTENQINAMFKPIIDQYYTDYELNIEYSA